MITDRRSLARGLGVASLLLLGAALILLTPTGAMARDFYVSPAGADSRPCDLETAPCRTIGHATNRALQSGGSHTIHVAARDGGARAVYRETIRLRQASKHRPKVVIDGSWRGGAQGRALIAPTGAVDRQVALLALPGATLRRIDIDASAAAGAAAAVVLSPPGTDQVLREVKVKAAPGTVGVVVDSPAALLWWVDVSADGSPALDYSPTGPPVTVQDSSFRQSGDAVAIRGGGESSLILRRSVAIGSQQHPRAITTEGGRLFLDSALISGGRGGAIHLGGPTGPSLRAVSSTIDAGQAGVSDPGVAAVTLATGGNAEVDIIGSILLEPPLITVAGAATIRCSHTDIPDTVVAIATPPQTISCGSGAAGNTHTSPQALFVGQAPFTSPQDYRLRAGASAINTGPRPAPPDATPFDLAGEARIQPPGTCAEAADVIDKGAYEFGCSAVAGTPRPLNLRQTLAMEGGAAARTRRPRITRQRPLSRRVAPRHRVRVRFRLNLTARVTVRVRGKRVRVTRKRVRAGHRSIALPTRRLRARKRPYRVRLIARAGGKRSVPKWTSFRVVNRRR